MKKITVILLACCCLATPAFALTYPVSGRWGLSAATEPGPIDCAGKRVIRFDPYRRFDTGGGVPDYRVIDLVNEADTTFRITEEFHTGQIRAQIRYTLRLIDSDRIELAMSPGGTLKLTRCV
ncbi:MAG TPA: hypothetical protein VFK79_13770 [Xanthobacteraceae bacterium]|nr:hypothetical protein [Xanthobacteraceae bacterium]